MNKRLRNIIFSNLDNKLKLFQEGKKLSVTRSAIAVNPLTCYNVSTGNVMEQFANNLLVKHGDYGFVGGDTLEVTFDMGTKVANDVVACPMKAYWQFVNLASLPNPTTGWTENTGQSFLDLLKTQDNNSWVGNTSTSGQAIAYMLELDLTPLCNQLFGGSNAALKAALKSITADIWAMGSGSNASVLTNGVQIKAWANGTDNVWGTFNTAYTGRILSNNTGSIAKMSIGAIDQVTSAWYTNSSNKIYFLIHATYPSDGTIASSVSLDYAKITLQLNRTVDVVAPKSVYLPKYWAMVVKGIAQNWIAPANGTKCYVKLVKDDNTDRTDIRTESGSPNNLLVAYRNGNTVSKSSAQISNKLNAKLQIKNMLLWNTPSGFSFAVLDNNGTVSKITSSDVLSSGLHQVYMGSMGSGSYSDSFAESFQIYDLQALGKSNGLSDAEAEVILRGIQYPSTSEMVVNGDFANGSTGWALHANASVSGGQLVLNSTAQWQDSSQTIDVLPNSTYTLKGNYTGNGARITIHERNASGVTTKADSVIMQGEQTESTLTTLSNTYKVTIVCNCSLIGNNQVTFDNISLKYIKPSGALITAPNKELFDINAVTLHANAVRSGNMITVNATAPWQNSTIIIPVLPNNKYELTGVMTGAEARVRVDNYYNNILISNTNDLATLPITVTTGATTNFIKIRFENSNAGICTFSNISLKLKM